MEINMATDFKTSETRINLMRAFAGESQARNRYTFAASQAKEQKLHVVEAVFKYTAGQEKEHAEIFYNFLKESAGENINIAGGYPVDINESMTEILRYAQRNEFEEHDSVYSSFATVAQNEGFTQIAVAFQNIAKIEKIHGERFKKIADLLEQNKLFCCEGECRWVCLNCGHIHVGREVPEHCPVCSHAKGYFIREEAAPYSF